MHTEPLFTKKTVDFQSEILFKIKLLKPAGKLLKLLTKRSLVKLILISRSFLAIFENNSSFIKNIKNNSKLLRPKIYKENFFTEEIKIANFKIYPFYELLILISSKINSGNCSIDLISIIISNRINNKTDYYLLY